MAHISTCYKCGKQALLKGWACKGCGGPAWDIWKRKQLTKYVRHMDDKVRGAYDDPVYGQVNRMRITD